MPLTSCHDAAIYTLYLKLRHYGAIQICLLLLLLLSLLQPGSDLFIIWINRSLPGYRCWVVQLSYLHLRQLSPENRRNIEPVIPFATKKVKVAHARLPSVRFRSWSRSRFLAASLQATWVINPAVGCHYFPPGLQLPPQPLKGLLPVFAACWTEARWVWTVCLRLLPDSVAAAIWTQTILRLSPAS